MKNSTFAYVCAPYAPDREITLLHMKEYCRKLYGLDYIPICPNLLYPQILDENIPEQREARTDMALALLRRCRVMVVCGEEVTQEMEREIILAKRLGIVSTTLSGIEKLSLYGKKGKGIA